MIRRKIPILFPLVLIVVFAVGYYFIPATDAISSEEYLSNDPSLSLKEGMVWIPGGTFTMGSNDAYQEERSEHKVTIDGFWIDQYEVTNAQFARFVEETGYVTVAEQVPNPESIQGAPEEMFKPGSVVFTPPKSNVGSRADMLQWWSYVPGANWKHPEGPNSDIEGKENYPVVHIAFKDAEAYAKWAGRELPTEAQFEFAAASKRDGEMVAWGGSGPVSYEGEYKANTWQGVFPVENTEEDGYAGIAPVGRYAANGYGTYDLIGNVWEWTADWYVPFHGTEAAVNPAGPSEEDSRNLRQDPFPLRVVKGGSFLCSPDFCRRYRPSARHAQDTGIGSNHIGFRTVLNKNL